MRTFSKIILIFLFLAGVVSCNYLDVVPDEREKAEDAFEDVEAVERYLYSCYAYLPTPRSGSSSLDFMTGDEVITAFEHETFAAFPKGNYTASNPVISYWNTFFKGLRQCYMLINNIDNVPNFPEEEKKDYIAQVKFLIAYYHFLLVRCYGPVIVISEEPDMLTLAKDFKPRTPFDECVDFVCNKFDEAALNLPAARSIRQYGLATSVAAKALKAKMLLYAASPLFNGNSEYYSEFKDKEGKTLMPLVYEPGKWKKAKDAYLEAIQFAEEKGYKLYMKDDYNNGNLEPVDPVQHRLRYNIIESGNPEIIWADCRGEGYYGLQNKSTPFCNASAWNGVAPTLAMLKRFYTKNGLPLEADPSVSMDHIYDIVPVDLAHASEAAVGQHTIRFNLDREPRYYAWIAFQGGFYEILSSQSNGAYSEDPSYNQYSAEGKGKLVCNFLTGGNCARNNRKNDYSPTGYLNKKGVDPGFDVSKSLKGPLNYPWPIVRLAELYLGYAESCVETGDLPQAKTYLNKIRQRAGIPTVEESWETIAGKTLDKELLRSIVRNERQIEFYLENQNFWDLRRWKEAEKYFNVKAQGFDTRASDINSFAQVKTVDFERKFERHQYLLPIPLGDIQKNLKLVQNPGY